MADRLALFPIHISFFPLSVCQRTYTPAHPAPHVQKSLNGCKWTNINKSEDQRYRLNAYRVLLTKARQGTALVVPYSSREDAMRHPSYYELTWDYFVSLDLEQIQ